MKINIYLSNLKKYVSGNDNGEWLTLPMSEEVLKEKFLEIVGVGNEWIILDSSEPELVSAYDDVFSLNNFLLEANSDFNQEEITILSKVVDTLEDLKELLVTGDYTIINANEVSEGWMITYGDECYGMVLHECGYNNLFSHPIPEEMIDYINFEQLWIALSINDGWEAVNIDNVTYLVTTKF